MKKLGLWGLLTVILILMSAAGVYAQEDDTPVYYVRLDHTGCEDGSQECPFNSLVEAIAAGQEQICDGRIFEVHQWNSDAMEYEFYKEYPGEKPIPPSGLPLAPALVVGVVAVLGLGLLIVALRMRKQAAE
jgi:hypothetical protein